VTDAQRKARLEQLAKKLQVAKTDAERDRLMAQVSGILGEGPESRDQELEESWERSRG